MLDFLGIGAQKAGSTWLKRNLDRHERVSFPGGKEIHYWDRYYPEKPVTYYVSLFEQDDATLKGEVTPAYAILDVSVVRKIQEIYPNLNLFYIIRNPIDRAWSAVKAAVTAHSRDYAATPDEWLMDFITHEYSISHGDYETNIRKWRSVFPHDNLLILRYEDIVNRPRDMIEACCRHIGLDEDFFDAIKENSLSEAVNAGEKIPIRPSLLPDLVDLYREKVYRLSEYLQADLSGWIEMYRH